MAYPGSSITIGEGTTITDPALYFVQPTQLYNGDVIKMPSGLIYEVDGWPSIGIGGISCANFNPETVYEGMEEGWWKQCNESMNQISFSDNINILDIFSSFVNKFCAHCGTESYCKVEREAKPVSVEEEKGCGHCPEGWIEVIWSERCERYIGERKDTLVCENGVWVDPGAKYSNYLEE